MKKLLLYPALLLFCLLCAGCEPKTAYTPDSPEKIAKDFYNNLRAKKLREAYYLIHPDCRKLMSEDDFALYFTVKKPFMLNKISKTIIGNSHTIDKFDFLNKTYREVAEVPTRQILHSKNGKGRPITFLSHLARDENGNWRMLVTPVK